MPKWMLYVLLAIVDFGFAWYFYSSGRVVFPVLAGLAGLGFLAAAIGTLMQRNART